MYRVRRMSRNTSAVSHPRRRLVALAALSALGGAFPEILFAQAASSESAAGPYRIRTVVTTWQDSARQRVLPVKLYIPQLEDASAQAPVIVFSHGLGGSREGGALWGAHWASYGFLSVHLQHPGSDETLWRDRTGDRTSLREAMRAGISVRTALDRIADVRFAVDELARRAQAGDPNVAMADLTRLGMSGHSYGAWTTLAIMGQAPPRALAGDLRLDDPRFRCAIAFSPAAANGPASKDSTSRMTRPLFAITGTHDGDVLGNGASPERRREVFARLPPPDKFLLILDGADHMVFNGGAHQPPFGGLTRAEILRIDNVVRSTTIAFWNAYLRDDAAAKAWLREGVRAVLDPHDVWEAK
jgi:predicted dienelactone hydrolase